MGAEMTHWTLRLGAPKPNSRCVFLPATKNDISDAFSRYIFRECALVFRARAGRYSLPPVLSFAALQSNKTVLVVRRLTLFALDERDGRLHCGRRGQQSLA